MRFLSKEDSKIWCLNRSLGFDPYGESMLTKTFQAGARFLVPRDSGKIAALSSNFRRITGISNDALILVLGWGIFPSCENPDLFYRYRLSFGEERTLMEAPGNFISRNEDSSFASIVHLCMISFWDFWVIDADLPLVVRIDHDDRLEIASGSQQSTDEAAERFTEFGIQTA
jgi:hypothetical protein